MRLGSAVAHVIPAELQPDPEKSNVDITHCWHTERKLLIKAQFTHKIIQIDAILEPACQ